MYCCCFRTLRLDRRMGQIKLNRAFWFFLIEQAVTHPQPPYHQWSMGKPNTPFKTWANNFKRVMRCQSGPLPCKGCCLRIEHYSKSRSCSWAVKPDVLAQTTNLAPHTVLLWPTSRRLIFTSNWLIWTLCSPMQLFPNPHLFRAIYRFTYIIGRYWPFTEKSVLANSNC